MSTTYRTQTNLSADGIATIVGQNHVNTGACAGESDIIDDTQEIGIASEPVTTGEIADGSAMALEIVNLDDTHFVSFSFENPAVAGTKSFKLNPGQNMLLANPSGGLFAIADTAPVKILKRAVQV